MIAQRERIPRKCLRPRLIAISAILLALLTLRVAANATLAEFGIDGDPIFYSPDDRFADSLKIALAQTTITDPLRYSSITASWPPLIQKYLTYNDYLQAGATFRHLPPLSTLLMMAFAGMLFILPPYGVVCVLTMAYAAGAAGISRMFQTIAQERIILPVFLLTCLSFPALFMIDRGNLHSGFSSLLVLFFVFATVSQRFRAMGWLALAVAANIRPNLAIFALLELASGRPWREILNAWGAILAIGLTVCCGSLLVANHIDPAYSFAEFLRSYGWYQRNYVEGRPGMEWNLSLQNLVKLYLSSAGSTELYSAKIAGLITLTGSAIAIVVARLYRTGRMAAPQVVFAITAICALFTPVFAEYHGTIFAAPLLLCLIEGERSIGVSRLFWGGGLLLVLQIACLYAATEGSPIPAIFLSLAFPLIADRLQARGEDPTNCVVVLACMAALAPLGGATTNGMVIGLVLASTLAWLTVRHQFPTNPRAYGKRSWI